MALRCTILGHRWSDWSDYEDQKKVTRNKYRHGEVVGEVDFVYRSRSRRCKRCGKKDEETKQSKKEERESNGSEDDSSKEKQNSAGQLDASLEAHLNAGNRRAPVELGQIVRGGVEEFSEHYSGRRDAIIRHQGFVIFVKDVPEELRPLDMVRVKVTSFNRGNTSANAHLVEIE